MKEATYIKHIDALRNEFEGAEFAEDFGMENIQDLFAHINHLTQHIEQIKRKPRREDAIAIRELQKQLSNQKELVKLGAISKSRETYKPIR